MEENELKATYNDLNQRPCVFQKALLTRRCSCEKAVRFWLAEREGIGCRSASMHQLCLDFLGHLRSNARFALQLNDPSEPLPHAKALKLQNGGLLGLQHVLTPGSPPGEWVEDVQKLIALALEEFESLGALPYSEILRDVAAFQGRPRRSRSVTP